MFFQILVNSIYISSIYIPIGLSFLLVYNTSKFFVFSHASIFTLGAYLFYLSKQILHLPIVVSFFLSILICVFVGCILEIYIYRKIREENSSNNILMFASLGINILIQNIISLFFGDDAKSVLYGDVQEGINILNAKITLIQLLIITANFIVIIFVFAILRNSLFGKAIKAVSNDPVLSKISGIDNNKIILYVFALSSGVIGLCGLLISFDISITPTMGMNAMMMGIVTMIIGGIGSIPGVVLGAFLLGLAQHLGMWKISSLWQDAIAFIILFIFLLFKPEGFMGKKLKQSKI